MAGSGEFEWLQRQYNDSPEQFPEKLGYAYYIVQLDSSGNMVRATGPKFTVKGGSFAIRQLPEDIDPKIVHWRLKRKTR